MGVEVGGESRAYPLNMLGGHPSHEVVNDTLGGRPIAVTYCSICESPLVFSRRVDDRTLTFQVAGELVDSNMLLKDMETGSGWVQLLGKAVDGPLRGKQLGRFPSVWTDWKTWRSGHPATTAIKLARYGNKYSPAIPGTNLTMRPAFLESLQRGLSVEGKARSWPFSRLVRERVVNDAFDDRPLLIVADPDGPGPNGFDRRLDDKLLAFRLRGADLVDEATGSTWDPSTGRAIAGPLQGRQLVPVFGDVTTSEIWQAFHKEGEIWDPSVPSPDPSPSAQ